jgi:hypothetical protein
MVGSTGKTKTGRGYRGVFGGVVELLGRANFGISARCTAKADPSSDSPWECTCTCIIANIHLRPHAFTRRRHQHLSRLFLRDRSSNTYILRTSYTPPVPRLRRRRALTMPSATGQSWEKYQKNFADDEVEEKKITPLTDE